jgi:hypothetical protein
MKYPVLKLSGGLVSTQLFYHVGGDKVIKFHTDETKLELNNTISLRFERLDMPSEHKDYPTLETISLEEGSRLFNEEQERKKQLRSRKSKS